MLKTRVRIGCDIFRKKSVKKTICNNSGVSFKGIINNELNIVITCGFLNFIINYFLIGVVFIF